MFQSKHDVTLSLTVLDVSLDALCCYCNSVYLSIHPSVCPSVCHTADSCLNGSMYRSVLGMTRQVDISSFEDKFFSSKFRGLPRMREIIRGTHLDQ